MNEECDNNIRLLIVIFLTLGGIIGFLIGKANNEQMNIIGVIILASLWLAAVIRIMIYKIKD